MKSDAQLAHRYSAHWPAKRKVRMVQAQISDAHFEISHTPEPLFFPLHDHHFTESQDRGAHALKISTMDYRILTTLQS